MRLDDGVKSAMRTNAAITRRAAFETLGNRPGELFKESFLSSAELCEAAEAAKVVAGYWPHSDEMDVRPLMEHFHGRGLVCALPVVVSQDQPLVFRRWRPGMELAPGAYDIPVPPPEAPVLTPKLVLVPFLAFDRKGWRIGYGGGYYDRTLEGLRDAAEVVAVGAAYGAQEVAEVPHDFNDQKLDWVVTEKETLKITT